MSTELLSMKKSIRNVLFLVFAYESTPFPQDSGVYMDSYRFITHQQKAYLPNFRLSPIFPSGFLYAGPTIVRYSRAYR